MGNKERYRQDITHFIDVSLKTSDEETITEYLVSNSSLPSPRANLELAKAFTEVAEDYSKRDPEKLWSLCLKLTSVSPDEDLVNNPREFLPFCGAYAVGAVGSVSPAFFGKALSRLQELANDPRWRIREAVAMGIQKLIAKQSQNTLKELEDWIKSTEWLAMRAVAAGVAEPILLKDNQIAQRALELHKKIFAKILTSRERKSHEFKTMKKGLGYTLSVVTYATPKKGFEYMRRLVDSQDADVLWIIKENLKKNRLIKNFPIEVASIKRLLRAPPRI